MITPAERAFNRVSMEHQWPHRCTILQREQTGTDPFDAPIYGDYEPTVTGLQCRFWSVIATSSAGGEMVVERREIIRHTFRIKVPVGTDIHEDDHIDDVVNESGERLHERMLNVTSVVHIGTALLLECEEIRS